MRRFGAILMIFGVNIAVAAVAAAVWVSALECAAAQSEGSCRAETLRLFVERMTSGGGLAYWLVVAAGLLVFWRGKQIRGR